MTEEQRRMLAAMVKKHPGMRVSSLMRKIEAQIKVNQLRAEMGYRPERTEAQKEMLAGIGEWM
ncbi:hypothetical protein GB928_018340 [Shinella curvata]|uniref:Transposase n=1 Tax=Shinella curvata TaxID=1817964 RepID=A0ABT8XHI5_9HYPH|nr:hypothetical protein [Shinella curvata]MCJ8053819.1 hypothetical protein [Shinella curvata]MDO6123151.1 hypothetical protein [Shinella curvata]